MDILITKSYRKICCEIKYGIVQNCIATDAVFHIEARDITKEEEMDLLIRQLQQLRHEIADGCTKPTICPTEHLCQTESHGHIEGKQVRILEGFVCSWYGNYHRYIHKQDTLSL